MKRVISVILISALLFSFAACARPAEITGGSTIGTKWSAGYGQAALVPPDFENTAYYIAGYAVDKRITGVLDYQQARAVWLDDNSGGGGVVIAVVDCIGLLSRDVAVIRETLREFTEKTGCRSVNVVSTHTHAGVDTLGLWGPIGISGRDPAFMRVVYEGVADAVRQAYENRAEGRLFYGFIESPPLQNDTRAPVVYDSLLHSIRFVPDNGGGAIRVVNYAAHPEALRGQNTLISADFPAYMAEEIKRAAGEDVIYIPAAIGGLINTKRQYDENGAELPDIESTARTGRLLAEAALDIGNERELSPRIALYRKEIAIPVDNNLYVVSTFLGIMEAKTLPYGGGNSLSLVTEAGFLVLGDLRIFLVPGELFPELAYGGAARNTGINPPTLTEIAGEGFLVFGLCNDEIGYIVPPGDFVLHGEYPYFIRGTDENGESHYEENNSVGPLAAELLVGALEELFVMSGMPRGG
jgi:hypothetical protein